MQHLIIKSDTPSFSADRVMEVSSLIERDVPIDFLVYRPEEFEKRISLGDPFISLNACECCGWNPRYLKLRSSWSKTPSS